MSLGMFAFLGTANSGYYQDRNSSKGVWNDRPTEAAARDIGRTSISECVRVPFTVSPILAICFLSHDNFAVGFSPVDPSSFSQPVRSIIPATIKAIYSPQFFGRAGRLLQDHSGGYS